MPQLPCLLAAGPSGSRDGARPIKPEPDLEPAAPSRSGPSARPDPGRAGGAELRTAIRCPGTGSAHRTPEVAPPPGHMHSRALPCRSAGDLLDMRVGATGLDTDPDVGHAEAETGSPWNPRGALQEVRVLATESSPWESGFYSSAFSPVPENQGTLPRSATPCLQSPLCLRAGRHANQQPTSGCIGGSGVEFPAASGSRFSPLEFSRRSQRLR